MPRAHCCGFWTLDPPTLSGFFTFTLQCITYTNSGSNLFSTAGMQRRFPQGNVTSMNKMKKISKILKY